MQPKLMNPCFTFLRNTVFLLFLIFFSAKVFSQDCSGANPGPVTGGLVQISNGPICGNSNGAGTLQITVGNVNDLDNPANVQVLITWGDGTTQTISTTTTPGLTWGGVGTHSYTTPGVGPNVISHVFPATGANVNCEYLPTANLVIAGTTCATSLG